MSIQSEIDRIENNIAATYAELEEQGATMPSARNSTNLAATAATTKTVKYIAQTLTAAQKEQARANIGAVSEEELPNAFYVTVTASSDSEYAIPDKSFAEIVEAYNAGKPVYCKCFNEDIGGYVIASMVALSEGQAIFAAFTDTLIGILVGDGLAMVQNIPMVTSEMLEAELEVFLSGVVSLSQQSLSIHEKKQARENIGIYTANVKDYGAKGDNSTDDTTAFRNALAANRVVYVPGGKYKLSGELVIDSNCQLELAQDAVLYFTQTTGNCISMKSSANIVGNHATISVPYAFAGKVINIDAALNATESEVPPYPQWGPMWKTARYITDLNIVKLSSSGHHYSENGQCSGTAIYIKSYSTTKPDYIWALDLSGLRIAGAFSYGIYTESNNPPDDWLHQMRISGFVDGAEVGVYLKKSDLTYLSVLVLPRVALDGTFYAKWGICLDNSNSVDMSGSRVMDWDQIHSLWREGSINQHLAMLGNCYGAILNEYEYYARPTYDIRSLIYTDYPKNYETLTIIQEPITRWFKPIDHVPYFNDGATEKKLVLQEELDEIVDTERTANFTNMLPTAIDTDGSVYNGIGYIKSGYRLNTNGSLLQDPYCGCTGFIPVKQNDVVYVKNIKFATSDQSEVGHPCIVSYDSSFAYMAHRTGNNVATDDYFFGEYELLEDGFKIKIFQRSTVAYIRLSYPRANISDQPIVSINNPITYSQVGYLQDGVKVKTANVEGLSEILGSYIDDVDALLGGG